ncbi:hypothetical protein NEIELOOT_01149 [Neisseria elongata subsp. glycolytica ATCC 29315]|uniref:Uncharacterized protein n=1 Tax=Neisseria elongata subsp. glycolytica ATCC 29315 TaxID=546263 RepID=D4DQ12_NEIEG|nr:hypothetical protein NEIELOOT_01149 [Neisseria elongata subsp. glycolytica ATCC 29315]
MDTLNRISKNVKIRLQVRVWQEARCRTNEMQTQAKSFTLAAVCPPNRAPPDAEAV